MCVMHGPDCSSFHIEGGVCQIGKISEDEAMIDPRGIDVYCARGDDCIKLGE